MKVLVAPDKFKGSLSAREVAQRLTEGLTSTGINTLRLPLADGGDGSVDAAIAAGFTPYPVTVAGAMGTPQYATIAVRDGTALIEVANTCGLNTLPNRRSYPLDATSLGVGQAIAQAMRLGPSRLVLALGGSASTDGGTGLLSALGFVFYDAEGQQLRACGRTLHRIHRIDDSRAVNLTGVEIIVAGDVTNPLTGPNGTAKVYGPQKGADESAVAFLDTGLNNLVRALSHCGYPEACLLANSAGSGSAGGIGFAALLLGARITSGAKYFLDLLHFDDHLSDADLVVTGEGCIDEQTGHGKLLSVLARRAHPVPVIAVAGLNKLPRNLWLTSGFERVYAIDDYTEQDTAIDPQLTGRLLIHIGQVIGHSVITSTRRREQSYLKP
ncbi:glycerate kinase (plasmid) [Rhodococcus globerulus]|uniref:glycerate kinase n=1 Tax=Rhodococcus globerulus TaxID=33008 RepID=UPI0039ECF33D